MSDKLKKFVNEHKEQFDSNTPSKSVWDKIDAGLDAKDHTQISSGWLSKFKYIALSASVLVIAIYFITTNLNHSTSSEQALNRKDSANNSERFHNANQNRPELSSNPNTVVKENNPPVKKEPQIIVPVSSHENEENMVPAIDTSVNDIEEAEEFSEFENEEIKVIAEAEKKETKVVGKKKKAAIFIPEDFEEANNYSGTLYEGSDICSVVGAFKCPGKVDNSKNNGKANLGTASSIKTSSCFRLERLQSITAVWFKGKADKRTSIVIKKGFKNIVLVKPNGKRYSPIAISHYFRGRTVIHYIGKTLNLVYKDKVEILLFFKNAQEGDKIIIDGTLQTVVRAPR